MLPLRDTRSFAFFIFFNILKTYPFFRARCCLWLFFWWRFLTPLSTHVVACHKIAATDQTTRAIGDVPTQKRQKRRNVSRYVVRNRKERTLKKEINFKAVSYNILVLKFQKFFLTIISNYIAH